MKALFVSGWLSLIGATLAAAQGIPGSVIYHTARFAGKAVPIYGIDLTDPTYEVHGDNLALYARREVIVGAGYRAELWMGPSAAVESGLSPVAGTRVPFLETIGAIDGITNLRIPETEGGDLVTFQLRVWAALTANGDPVNSWLEVVDHPDVPRGKSNLAKVVLGNASADHQLYIPQNLAFYLEGFGLSVIPEPSVSYFLALGSLGLLGVARRRKHEAARAHRWNPAPELACIIPRITDRINAARIKTGMSIQQTSINVRAWGVGAAVFTLFAGALGAQDVDHDGLSDSWERGVGRYEIIPGAFTWQQAKADAEGRGAHLATVVNAQEWNDLKSVLGASLRGKNLWLGGTDEGTEGTWRWITGEQWTFANWRINEPGNDSIGNGQGAPENYLMIWGNETVNLDGNNSYWNDATLTGGLLARDGYVLERGSWTDANDPDTDDDGLADSEELLGAQAFEVVRGTFTWLEAKADAEARGGHLGVITSAEEWTRVTTALGQAILQGNFWLGASDAVIEGQWRWITGEPFAYQRWASQQPDNLFNQDYMMLGAPNGVWYDSPVNAVTAGYLLERENAFKTDPNNPDTDGDGLKDGDEAKFYRTDPARVDTDGDSLSDFEEIRRWKSNPLLIDSDSDGLNDADEVFTFRTDPTKSDTDGDGYSDRQELENESDPNSPASIPGVRARIYTAVEIEFDTKPGLQYQIQFSTQPGNWQNVGLKIQGNGAVFDRLFSTKDSSRGFWRVIIVN